MIWTVQTVPQKWRQKLDGVKSATISFMTQKLTLEADDADFDKVLKAAQKCISKVEPDCEIIIK